MRFSTALSLGATLLAWSVPFAIAECCSCPNDAVCEGGGGTCVPFISCCGQGYCNIVCCNCDGGCRGNKGLLKSSQFSLHGGEQMKDCKNTVEELDLNSDGNITFLEWAFKDGSAPPMPIALLMERWLLYDTEGKGYLTVEEAYHRKA